MSDQRRRRWADVVQILYKCFVFAGLCGDQFVLSLDIRDSTGPRESPVSSEMSHTFSAVH